MQILKTMRKNCLHLFGHVQRRPDSDNSESLLSNSRKRRSRLKMTWITRLKNDMKRYDLQKYKEIDRVEPSIICVNDH